MIYGPKSIPERPYHGENLPSDPGFGDARPVNCASKAQPVTGGENAKDKGIPDGHDVSLSWGEVEDDYEDEDDEDDGVALSHGSGDKEDEEPSSGRSSAAPSGQRTVLLRGLPDWVSHHQITEAIKGGALLHIYLRGREHLVNVSFVEESAAQEFLNYARTYGVYIAGKRVSLPFIPTTAHSSTYSRPQVEALWSNRQFYLPPYVRAKIIGGATRNLVLYNVNHTITESLIRRDLNHIHNLVVISVKFKDGNVYISTNSVHNTLFARSCMMSRSTYKGIRISFYPDECDEPLPKVPLMPAPAKTENQVARKKRPSHANRFQLLSLDGAEDDTGDMKDECGINGLNGGISWTDNRVSV